MPLHVPCRIVAVHGNPCVSLRVRELGLIPGTHCTVERRAPFGGPREVMLDRRTVAVRPTPDVVIMVEPLVEPVVEPVVAT